ncbi:MAG: ATP synthase F1 subunit delta [Deltaproteobacteria bacterium]|nr:ATP synthase F1 subunit delta [Deltaproteobacteria bacterium]
MPQTPAARRYAKALLDLAQAQKAEEVIANELSQIVTAIADPAIEKVMLLPTLPLTARKEIVEQLITSAKPNPTLSSFLRVLADNDRLSMLKDVYDSYQALLEQASGKVRAQIRTAAALSNKELKSIVDAFSRLTKKTVLPTVTVDPTLLGGVVVEIQGRVWDASLLAQLRRMGDALAQQI